MSQPVFAQDAGVDTKAALELQRKELDAQIKEICDHPLVFPRTYYLKSTDKGSFYKYARNIDKLLDSGIRKSSSGQTGYVAFAVRVASSGDLISIEILRSEGSEEIGELVKRLLQSGAPYPAFSPKMKSVADEMVIVRTVKSDHYRIPPASSPQESEEAIKATKERIEQLTEENDRLYKRLCGSRFSTR